MVAAAGKVISVAVVELLVEEGALAPDNVQLVEDNSAASAVLVHHNGHLSAHR